MFAMMVGLAVVGCSGRGTFEPAAEPDLPDDVESGPVILASAQLQPSAIAVGPDGVYWVNRGDGSYHTGAVLKLATGAAEPTVLVDRQDFPTAIAVDEESVFWAAYGAVGTGTVLRTSLDGAGIYALAAGVDLAGGISVDDTRAYWTDTVARTVESVSKSGEQASTLAIEQPALGPIASAGGSVFWGAGHGLWSAREGDSAAELVWEGEAVAAVATGDHRVAWITRGGDVMTATLDGSQAELLFAGDGEQHDAPGAIAVDTSGLYFGGVTGLVHVTFDGEAIDIAAGGVTAIALDGAHVYWTDAELGRVLRADKIE